jgi:hypothetical protein
MLFLLQLSAVRDDDFCRSGSISASLLLDFLDDIKTLFDFSEDDVLSIEPRARNGGDEELGSVGVGSSIGHREQSRLGVLVDKVLIGKLFSVNGLSSSSISSGKVSSLEHELGNHSVELAALVSKSLFSSAEGSEVFNGLGDIIVQLEDNSSSCLSSNSDVEEALY